jgi:hypothetical protein
MGKRTILFHGCLFALISAVCYTTSFTQTGSRELVRTALRGELFPLEAGNDFWAHYARNTALVLLLMSTLNFATLWAGT